MQSPNSYSAPACVVESMAHARVTWRVSWLRQDMRRTTGLALIAVAFVSGIAFAAMLTVPVQHSISGEIPASTYWPADGTYRGSVWATYPPHAVVHLEWTETGLSSTTTSPVTFSVFPQSTGGDGCWSISSGGSCMFTATGGTYVLAVIGQAGTGVSYTGSYAVPLLVVH